MFRTLLIAAACLSPSLGLAKPALGRPAAAPAQPAEVTPLAHVEVRGSGATAVVLIPDMYCDWTVFESFMAGHGDQFTMYAVTLPGFGGSEPPRQRDGSPCDQTWLRNATLAVADMIRERGIERPVVVGHGLGGHIGMRLAVQHPELVGKLISIDGAVAIPLGPPSRVTPITERRQVVETVIAPQLRQMPADEWRSRVRTMLAASVKDAYRAKQLGDMAAQVPFETSLRYTLELHCVDLTPEVTLIQAPTLIVGCIPDLEYTMTTEEEMRASVRRQHSGIPQGRLVFIEDTRHFIMDDKPEMFASLIARFSGGEPIEGAQDL